MKLTSHFAADFLGYIGNQMVAFHIDIRHGKKHVSCFLFQSDFSIHKCMVGGLDDRTPKEIPLSCFPFFSEIHHARQWSWVDISCGLKGYPQWGFAMEFLSLMRVAGG